MRLKDEIDEAAVGRDRHAARGIKELAMLYEISAALNESLDLRGVFSPVLEMMASYMEMHRGTITILNRETGEIVIEEAYGLSPDERARGKYRPGEGITGRVVETGRAVLVPSISSDPQFLGRTGSRDRLNRDEIAFICVPVKIGAEVIGTLSADRLFSDEVSLEEDLRLLTIIASSISQAVRLRQLAQEEIGRLEEENRRLQDRLGTDRRPGGMMGNSGPMREVFTLIERVRGTPATVLILGESGVGKELVAEAIHRGSERSGGPFVRVNCGALPETLIESELFGHERGSFTGAVAARRGRFEMADGGTLFLDEIGDLPRAVQVKLLRVLQAREFERVGGGITVKVDVRIIAATHRDLEGMVKEGTFREDLYYRLNVFPIPVPPLRVRRTDIMLLADHFAEKYGGLHRKEMTRISTPAIDMLMAYHWPGNVRELENCIERAVILSTDGVIHGYHLPPSLQMATDQSSAPASTLKGMVERYERELILEELKRARGNMAGAARSLGITERIMGLRVAKYGIDPARFR
ncbi:MAG: sigma 54-interacting transcriptional regulator [Spirochaetes bacterium]|nr:sigma 54-interacting transcriptional regulator [Spirochaetota bacterium]